MKASKNVKKYQREKRYFSEDFRRARVKEYEEDKASVSEICQAYSVSPNSVYKWIHKYSAHYQKSIIKVVEEKSETKKRLALEKKVQQLEQFVGQQQVEIQYYKQLIKLIQEQHNIDFEKNFAGKSWNGFSFIDPNTI